MAELTLPRLKEQALLVGPRRALVGILTPPAEGAPPRNTTVVMLNSGIIHRVGANRLHVELARELARAGFRVLRFDLSGVGDSPSRTDVGTSILDGVMKDIGEAVDHVAGKDGHVTLFGLCSGATHALLYAPHDPRVDGLMLLDLWLPRTRRYYWRRAWKRLVGRRGWINLLTGRHQIVRRTVRFVRERVLAPRTNEAVPEAPDTLPEDQATETDAAVQRARRMFADAFRPVVARKVPVLAVFTAGLEGQHNYATQLLDAFPEIDFGDRTKIEWFSESDHTFSSFEHRRRLKELVVSWMSGAPDVKPTAQRASSTTVFTAFWMALSSVASSLFSSALFWRR